MAETAMRILHVSSEAAPRPQGAYSQAVRTGDLLFCSTQLPIDPGTGEVVGTSPYRQATQCLENLDAVCSAAGASVADAARITVYLVDRQIMPDVDRAFRERFGARLPARVPVHVVSLARDAAVSMDAIVSAR